LIVGASGYVGRRALEFFGPDKALGTYNHNPAPGCVHFDCTKMRLADVLPAGAEFDHALVLYAEAGIDECKADLKRSHEINVRSTKQVIDDLHKLGIKPIFTSSEYVFNGKKGNYVEEDPAVPSTVYGSQKVEIEEYLEQSGKDFAVLRLAKVFGTDPQDGTILSSWIKQIGNGDELRCAGDQVFSPVHVDDVVAVSNSVIERGLNGIYNLGGPESFSRLGMLQKLVETMGVEANVVECSIKDFTFLDDRPLDLSMIPNKVLQATGLQFKTVQTSCETLLSLG